MLVHFFKMHGLGNDFVVLDRISQNLYLNTAQIQRVADRKLGIGCDQVILVEPPMNPGSDFSYRVFNPDGREVEQCGNGVRCAARFVYDTGLVKKTRLIADCLAGSMGIRFEKNQSLTVNLGVPSTSLHHREIELLTQSIPLVAVNLGNPHAVLSIPSDPHFEVPDWSGVQALVLNTGLFPQGVNIGWMQVQGRHLLQLRVLERGVGETLACGSAACAAVIAGRQLGLLDNPVTVRFALGDLRISWQGPDYALFMTGPATSVFQGRFRV